MQQLTGLDAEFLAMESATVYGHVASVCLLDQSTAAAPLTLARLTEHIAGRIHLVPLLRRRLVRVPLGLDQPYWVDDDVALDYHIREISLPAPGDDHQLRTQVSRLHGRALDRSRPLWEIYLITGLRGGRAAVYTKVHHAAMDGVSGDDVLAALLDLSPHGRERGHGGGDTARQEPPSQPLGARPRRPGAAWMIARGARSLATQPLRAMRLGSSLLKHSPELLVAAGGRLPLADRLGGERDDHPAVRAPWTPFNAAISAHRRVGFADLSLDRVKRVKRDAGVTINDVVMALCAGALRRWLLDHDALPHEPLIAAVPVSLRTQTERGSYGNRISFALAALPTDVADPQTRLQAAHTAMNAAKRDHGAIPPTLLADASDLAVPALATVGWQVAARLRLLERVNLFNLFISNIPGPRMPLYYAGARLAGYYPLSAIVDGQGLNITVVSYTDTLCVGLVACPSLVPNLDALAGYVADEFDDLTA